MQQIKKLNMLVALPAQMSLFKISQINMTHTLNKVVAMLVVVKNKDFALQELCLKNQKF